MQSLPGSQSFAIWQTLHWIVSPLHYLEKCAKKYGTVFTAPLGDDFTPIVFVSDPQSLEVILSRDRKELSAPGDANVILEPLLGPQALTSLSGARHQRQRQLMLPHFHGDRMKTYGDTMVAIAKAALADWSVSQTINVRHEMQKISLQVILHTVFGVTTGPRFQQLEVLLTEMLETFNHRLSVTLVYFPGLRHLGGKWGPWQRFLDKKVKVDQLIYDEIRDRKANPDPTRTDILHLLMETRDEQGKALSDTELHDELMTLLVAGHETTATAMAWALYWLAKYPNVSAKLQEELTIWQQHPDPIEALRLPYLTAICNETLRIYPVGMLTFPRKVETPIEIAGYTLPAGTLLTGCIYLAHQQEDTYPEAKTFHPERFLERKFSPYEFVPFGGGSRRCLGLAFAQFEMKVVLSTLNSHINFKLADPRPVRPMRRGLTAASTPIQLQVTKKNLPVPPRQPLGV